ncbi:MAG: hypothetical protein HZA53_11600 [Planctomycetes bacterium]|nr:hypothetical protein [Planctomycetota bacterium]
MDSRRARRLWSAVLLVSIASGVVGTAWANHRWGCWRYADANISFYNGCTGSYSTYVADEAINDANSWHNYTDVNLSPSPQGTTDHLNCFNGSYGINGWLGIAEILTYNGCTILQGRARFNQSYMDNPAYGYSTTNKKHVVCQEIGHLFGLDHQRGQAQSCMNDRILSVPNPNSHDQSLVNSIY